jgi:hypothetical protein
VLCVSFDQEITDFIWFGKRTAFLDGVRSRDDRLCRLVFHRVSSDGEKLLSIS